MRDNEIMDLEEELRQSFSPNGQQRIEAALDQLSRFGFVDSNGFHMSLGASSPTVTVRDSAGKVVAYSEMESDREASIHEFISDFMV